MKICPTCQRCYDDDASECVETGHPPLRTARPGTVRIAERYEIERLLGRGGTGTVFLARHLELERPVAIELLRPEVVADPEASERFRREARAIARIRHPNVADIYDYGMLPEGEAYIVMELVEGETLRQLIDLSGALAIPAAAEIGRQIAEGVGAAHKSGVIHRDLKPSNIILTRELGRPLVKIVDFSIAKPEPASDTARTASGAMLGTPRDLYPEQSDGRPPDVPSDIYNLGMILYQMLAGRAPFKDATPGALALSQTQSEPRPLQALRPDVPEALGWLVMQTLHQNPARRPQSAAEIASRLRPFEATEAKDVGPESGKPPPPAPVSEFSSSPEPAAEPEIELILAPLDHGASRAAEVGREREIGREPHWRSFDTAERGVGERSRRPELLSGTILGALAVAALVVWWMIDVTPTQTRAARAAPGPSASPRPAVAPEPAQELAPSPVEARPSPLPTGAPSPPPTPSPGPRSVTPRPARAMDARGELRQALDGWIAATNAGDVPSAMRFYMPRVDTFYLAHNVSSAFVQAEKRRLFGGARRIDVQADPPQINTDRAGQSATMWFRKTYSIEGPRVSRRGEVVQELRWVKTAAGWKIVGERDARVIR